MKQKNISENVPISKFVLAFTLLLSFIIFGINNFSKVEAVSTYDYNLNSNFIGETSLTMAKYNKIKNGMTYNQVVSIIGKKGEEITNTEFKGTKAATYKWTGEDYTFIFCNFKNDKLAFKSQANLK